MTTQHRRWCVGLAPFTVQESSTDLFGHPKRTFLIVSKDGQVWDAWHTREVAEQFAANWNQEAATGVMLGERA